MLRLWSRVRTECHRSHRSQGFTLIEVLVAMMILSGGVMVLANSWSGNFIRIRNSRINNTMAALLEKQMTEMEVKYRDKPVEEIAESEGADFGEQFPGYRWEMKSQGFEMPDMSGALIARDGGADEMTLMIVRTVQDYIKSTVKEMSVSVYYKAKNGRELKHTVTTYFVDYSKELPMPPGMPGLPGGAPGGAPGGG